MKYLFFAMILLLILSPSGIRGDETPAEFGKEMQGSNSSFIDRVYLTARGTEEVPTLYFTCLSVLDYYYLPWRHSAIMSESGSCSEYACISNIFTGNDLMSQKLDHRDRYLKELRSNFDKNFMMDGNLFITLNITQAIGLWKYGNKSQDPIPVINKFLQERSYYTGVRQEKADLEKILIYLDNSVPVILNKKGKTIMLLGYLAEGNSVKFIYYNPEEMPKTTSDYLFDLKTAVGRKGIGVMNWDGEGEMITIDWPQTSYFLLIKTL